MTPEQQRIAIAEACGIEVVTCTCCANPWKSLATGKHISDFLSDLNAMKEAEKVILDLRLYRRFLYLVVFDDPSNVANEPAWATAAQRAEAFLRTIGKWKEDT